MAWNFLLINTQHDIHIVQARMYLNVWLEKEKT